MFVNVLGDCSVLVRASGDKKDRYPRRCYDIANVAIIGNVVSIAYKRLTWNPDGSFKVREENDRVSLSDVVEINRLSHSA